MIIGVISDSHRETKVAASAIEWLLARGADLLVHAEGIVASETLRLSRQSGKLYFAVMGNNDEALAELKNDFNLHDEPFCTKFAGLRLKIMHRPFYLFDEEPATQNEADGLNLDADLGAGADRAANFRKDFGADLVKNSSFNDEVSYGTNLGSNCGADRGEILISNSKTTDRAANFRKDFGADLVKNSSFSDEVSRGTNLGSNYRADRGEILVANSKTAACSVNLNSNFNTTSADKILNGARSTDVNFKNMVSASANLKSRQSASLNASLGLNAGADVNSNANLDLDLGTGPASCSNANLNSNASANLAANMGSDMNSKASSGADRAANLTAPSLNVNLSTPNLSANLATPNLNSNLTGNSGPNASGEGKNRGPCGRDADKIPTIKIYGHIHFFAAAMDKNGALVLNPGEICGHKSGFSVCLCCGARAKIACI